MEEDNGVLLDLLMAVSIYVDAKTTKRNQFVKSLGRDSSLDEQEADKILFDAFEDAKHLIPKAEVRLEEMRRAIMEEIEEEERQFDNS